MMLGRHCELVKFCIPITLIYQLRTCSGKMLAAGQRLIGTAAPRCTLSASFSKCNAVHCFDSPKLQHCQQPNGFLHAPHTRPFVPLTHRKRGSFQMTHAAQAEVGKLISKVEIPAFIPRADLIAQLLRWAIIEVQENGMANVSCPCKVCSVHSRILLSSIKTLYRPQCSQTLPLCCCQVTPFMRGEELWGFTVQFLKDGVSATDVRVAFDEETTLKHEWVGRGAGLLPSECIPFCCQAEPRRSNALWFAPCGMFL